MQICLSQQSPSPSHHFLHSNAFSHLNKIPLPATRRGFARFVDIHFCTFATSSEETRNKRRFLRARLCMVYYRDSVETIKNGRAWRFFFFSFTMHHPPAPFSTGGSPSARRLCRMDGKGKRFFSPVSVLQTSLRQINGSQSGSPPVPASPKEQLSRFCCTVGFPCIESHNHPSIARLTTKLIQSQDIVLKHSMQLSPTFERTQ